MKPLTFEEWWEPLHVPADRKQVARAAWFAGQEQVNKALSWWRLPEGGTIPEGTPVAPGTRLYAFNEDGAWVFYLPPLS